MNPHQWIALLFPARHKERDVLATVVQSVETDHGARPGSQAGDIDGDFHPGPHLHGGEGATITSSFSSVRMVIPTASRPSNR